MATFGDSASEARNDCFYALGIGLGFATSELTGRSDKQIEFLCPRYRAVLCDKKKKEEQ